MRKRGTYLKKLQHLVEWWAFVAARFVVRCLPRRWAYGFAALAGHLVYLVGVRRRVVAENLARAFPEKPLSERRRIARKAYVNAAKTAVECLLLERLSPDQLDEMIEGLEGREIFESIPARRKPMIAVTAHVGNWELMGAYFARHGIALKVIAKPLHNGRVEAAVLAMRRACGFDVIYTRAGMRSALRHLRDRGVLAILADQDARKSGIAVPFFGVPASTAPGPAVLALLAGVPIVPVFGVRTASNRHRFCFLAPIEPPDGCDRAEAIEWMTRRHVEALEKFVREHPEQYFWFHKRWKTPPEKIRRRKEEPGAPGGDRSGGPGALR